jgi:multidrug efflux pump subunit AcrA (membrane-fusion protein)
LTTRGVKTGAAALAVASLFLAGCGARAATESPSAAAGREAQPGALRRGDFERELLLTGELEAVRSIAIKSPQTSLWQLRIQFMAEEGSFAKAGDPILEFDNSSVAAQVLDLETSILDAETQIVTKRNELATTLKDLEIELAQNVFDRDWAKLDAAVDPEVLSDKDYAERQLALTSAERELAETEGRISLTRERGQADLDVLVIERDKLQGDLARARVDLELLAIKAPADGLVVYERRERSTLRYQEGDSCWPGQGIMRLPDLSEMRLVFEVNEVDAPLLELDMPVKVTLDAFAGRELGAVITQIPSMAVKRNEDSKIAVFQVRAELSETWVGEMKPGMSALGRVVVDRRPGVPLADRDAVWFDGAAYWLTYEGAPQRIEPVTRNARFYVLSEEDFGRLSSGGGST